MFRMLTLTQLVLEIRMSAPGEDVLNLLFFLCDVNRKRLQEKSTPCSFPRCLLGALAFGDAGNGNLSLDSLAAGVVNMQPGALRYFGGKHRGIAAPAEKQAGLAHLQKQGLALASCNALPDLLSEDGVTWLAPVPKVAHVTEVDLRYEAGASKRCGMDSTQAYKLDPFQPKLSTMSDCSHACPNAADSANIAEDKQEEHTRVRA
ncbi:hypothetical protein AK812_SmicGene30514 [Symbiodinium microadriaticum]|uniref:Uncharacterized protein n=1 Tax=Symbiodinium microadriaticum TaxID=2951 RepID=A0A1Q9CZ38_SYMMI|nr:hypothetical protein AK812_SmicGene30514 [Symbiodinium microadriaticum]